MRIETFLKQSPMFCVTLAARRFDALTARLLEADGLNFLEALILATLFFESPAAVKPSQLAETFGTTRGMRLASWFGPFRHFVLAHPWDVEGLGNIHPVVVAAVGMWESLLSDFQGLWEGWENSFIVFPCFP